MSVQSCYLAFGGSQSWSRCRLAGLEWKEGRTWSGGEQGQDYCNLWEQTVIHKDNLKSMRTHRTLYLSPIISTSTTWKLGPFIMELHTSRAGTQRSCRRRSRGGSGVAGAESPVDQCMSCCSALRPTLAFGARWLQLHFQLPNLRQIFHKAVLAQTI